MKAGRQLQPESGPRIVFLSGGTAINGLAKSLTALTHNAMYLVTTFDSGGSSAELRKAFAMPAVGDLRSRLVALHGQSEIATHVAAFLGYRIPKAYSQNEASQLLTECLQGQFDLLQRIETSLQDLLTMYLQHFAVNMPSSFMLPGASMGNLVMAGCYLKHDQDLAYAVDQMASWLDVNASVMPISAKNCHIRTELESGAVLLGQHAITGKEVAPIQSPIANISLLEESASESSVANAVTESALAAITSADLICYPPGSFYTSLIANLLPEGVVAAIASNPCPKVYIPNLGLDPEQFQLSLSDQLRILLQYLKADTYPVQRLLNTLVVANAVKPADHVWCNKHDVTIHTLSGDYLTNQAIYNDELLAKALVGLV